MTRFIPQGQTELHILIIGSGVGAAIGLPMAGLKGLLVGAIAGPIVIVLVVLALMGAVWLVMRVKALFPPPGAKTTEEDGDGA